MNTKEKILEMLQKETQPVSGEVLSTRLGISRVSIWKHINRLKSENHLIEASPRGYRLKHTGDAPFPWNFPDYRERIHYFPEAASTMDLARDMARSGCPAFTTVVADRQTRGRGRLTRTWISDHGGLYVTLVTRPALAPVHSFKVNFVASVVMARLLRDRFTIDARVKWPNDILVGDKKICGMLSEMEATGDALEFVNIGIGLNVNNDPTPDEPQATSLAREAGKAASRKEILGRFLQAFETKLAGVDDSDIIAEWKKLTGTIGREVSIVTARDRFQGRAVDVDDQGALVLALADGTRQTVVYGDCFHAPGP
jgi:BirA family biotin operon repressor/biotin-[acetyl-CoA-carboxylase] ligase